MAITIFGYTPDEVTPRAIRPALVFSKAAWTDEWEVAPELAPDRIERPVDSRGVSRFTFSRPYGAAVKFAHQDAYAAAAPLDLRDHWIAVRIFGDDGAQFTLFTGRVVKCQRQIHGAEGTTPQGVQRWIAYGPAHTLQRTEGYYSYCEQAGGGVRQAALPIAFNTRGPRGHLVGNRSDDREGERSYLFSRSENLWTHYQALEYVVTRLIQEYDSEDVATGPLWTIDGQASILETIATHIPVPEVYTAYDLISAIVPRRFGLDWRIVETFDDTGVQTGYAIRVFSLLDRAQSYAGHTIPANAAPLDLNVADDADLTCEVEECEAQRYDELHIIGGPVVSCFTLALADDEWTVGDSAYKRTASAEKGWTDALETAFEGELTDGARRTEKYAPVYTRYVAKATWDWHAGEAAAYPLCDGSGDVVRDANAQTVVRATLPWLPLLEGLDYTADPATDNNPTGSDPDLLPPQAWAQNPTDEKYYPVDDMAVAGVIAKGVNVAVLEHDLGLELRARYQHYLGRNHFAGNIDKFDPATDFALDYETLLLTVAAETDTRLGIVYVVPGSTGNRRRVVRVPDAQWWYLAPHTVVGVDSDGLPVRSPVGGSTPDGEIGVVVRDDTSMLLCQAAGEIGRYLNMRIRASVSRIGNLEPWHSLLGGLVRTVDEGQLRQIGAVVSAVVWDFGGEIPTTTLRTGGAW